MIKILHINSVCGFGSTGKIVLSLSKSTNGIVCYGRKKCNNCDINAFKIADFFDNIISATETILFDNNMKQSNRSTMKLIKKIEEYHPDIIHLHNLHGYFLNVQTLFKFIKKNEYKVVWTLHDCWSYTGYCPYYDYVNCDAYIDGCDKKRCKYGFSYPFSLLKQNIKNDYELKKELFNSVEMTLVTPSKWLKEEVKKSFLKDKNIEVINNGVDIPTIYDFERSEVFTILFVANYWTKEKGVEEIKKVVPLLNKNIKVIIVGEMKNKNKLSNRCTFIERTENYDELLNLYKKSNLFVNLTLQDNFPTVNIEALSCGTPVITYNTGGSPEIVESGMGIVVEKFDFEEVARIINKQSISYSFNNEEIYMKSKKYSKEKMVEEYNKLYKRVILNGL